MNRTEVTARGIKWPAYHEDVRNSLVQGASGSKFLNSIIDTNLPNPYTVQSMVGIQRAIGGSLMAEVDYIRTDGRNFPLHRPFANAFDRQTGARPNPTLGSLSGYHVSSAQTMVYNALQTSLRRRFTNNVGFDVHYTLRKGWAEQGGGLSSNFVNEYIYVTQDFWDVKADRSPLNQEARHNISGNAIYDIPWLRDRGGVLSHILGGWQISSIVSIRSGVPLRVEQPSGITRSRPDYVGGNTVMSDWGETLQYLNRAAFAPVDIQPVTRIRSRQMESRHFHRQDIPASGVRQLADPRRCIQRIQPCDL
jgi:hypothetical protein